eukprot:scaffold65998_cov58-Attheya_sp.AAC.3
MASPILSDTVKHCGVTSEGEIPKVDRVALKRLIEVKLAASGFEVPSSYEDDQGVLSLAHDLFRRYAEQSRLLCDHLTPPDQRIQDFLDDALSTTGEKVQIPKETFSVDRYGIARELSLPDTEGVNEYHNEHVSSYRLSNGILHNPLNDRRTTKGVFHIADYGLPVPADKISVPLITYARLLNEALHPPSDLMELPYTTSWEKPVQTMVSLLLRPLVCPAVPGVRPEKRLEVRFFVPGGCVSNIDFVESIFGNAGDPHLPENDAGLDAAHWTGHTGCVILAPHIRTLKKKDMGLPYITEASDEQKETGMCWSDANEPYNGGKPFKITCRDQRGIMVTILADNYFGYCKKEVKTQIGFSANLYGLAEEEHAGGALSFQSFSLGTFFSPSSNYIPNYYSFKEAISLLGDTVIVHSEGYASDKNYPNVHIMPEDFHINLNAQCATWMSGGVEQSIRVLPKHIYLHPSGYKVRLGQHEKSPAWKLIGTVPEGVFTHKPCTVSGGGKSEISKSLTDAVIYGPIYTADYDKDMALVSQTEMQARPPSRKILCMDRTLGSVIKLLTQNEDLYTKEHNEFISLIPNHVRAIVFAIKRFYRPSWGSDWKSHFTVDIVNGANGHELKLNGRRLVGSYLRVGMQKESGAWRTYKLRQDFVPADKVQMEDDITASVVVPAEQISGLPIGFYKSMIGSHMNKTGHPMTQNDNVSAVLPGGFQDHKSLKIVQNCEWRLFQRPDDAIIPGFDKQTEFDMSQGGLFASNFKPIAQEEMIDISEQIDVFDLFTDHMKTHIIKCVDDGSSFNVCSAKPRIWEGKPTKNPRYLQLRPDIKFQQERYLAELGVRLSRRLAINEPVIFPVNAVIGGRRNNPPDEINGVKIRPLCVFNPIHYQELPELFMDYVCSVTGKSPSTTGAGSEGALTKGPFNAIQATVDLNNCLVSMLLTGYGGFTSAAGWIGPDYRFDHDISLLIPEIWCRMRPEECEPTGLIERGELEKIDDFEYDGRTIPASRLGYRITRKFVIEYFGRVFDNPAAVITDDILKPENQDLDVYVDGIENLVDAERNAALLYFKDGTIIDACPPLAAVLNVMAYGHYEEKSITDPGIRKMFTREALLESNWYKKRLTTKQVCEIALCKRNVVTLEHFISKPGYETEVQRLNVRGRLEDAKRELNFVQSKEYLISLVGTLGADPITSRNRSGSD